MDEKTQDLEGRTKEAAGDVTGDEELQREGKVDQAASSVKEKVSQAADKAKDALGRKDR
ncbi:MAG TPA: CsbD family protein [Solirubrobacteraceae bacterium]|nr:CsbD family protein [Solirubrobacteraceae bacterium]